MNKINADVSERRRHIDRSLIRENLKLTPRQRLEQLDRIINDLDSLRSATKNQLPTPGKR